MAVCSTCGRENPDDARFCNSCGKPLGPAAVDARQERKIVTVLFADLVGFTARAERLDPEDVRGILNRYYASLRTEIEVVGGTVEKFIGDAVVAVFGAPVAHGDDPERAVRAALAARLAVAELNAADPALDLQARFRRQHRRGDRLCPRKTGARRSDGRRGRREHPVAPAIRRTGQRGAGRRRDLPRNTRPRRVPRSRAGGRQGQGRAHPMLARGRDPVRARRAQGDERAAAGSRPRDRGAPPDLRRDRRRRRPHLVTIVGEAGIGKTRLAAEFCAQLEHEGVRTLRGRSLPYGAATLYGPFGQHVKGFAGIFASDDLLAGRAKLRTAMAGLAGAEPSEEITVHLELLIGLDDEGDVADRQILFLAARRFAEALANERPDRPRLRGSPLGRLGHARSAGGARVARARRPARGAGRVGRGANGGGGTEPADDDPRARLCAPRRAAGARAGRSARRRSRRPCLLARCARDDEWQRDGRPARARLARGARPHPGSSARSSSRSSTRSSARWPTQRIPRAARAERHAAVAGFLERTTAAAGATATALAQHWLEAGDKKRALGYLLLAADQAGRGWAKDEAAELYGQALELLPEDDADHRREISRKRGLALAALVHVQDARNLARRLEPTES